MDLRNVIETVDVLNIDKEESTASTSDIIFHTKMNRNSYIISDADEELLILVEFKQSVNLESIKIYADINDNDDNENDVSPPKRIHIYLTNNLNLNFDDLGSMTPDRSIVCNTKKLQKGQNVKLQKQAKNVVKFKNTKYLVIYIQSNQQNAENTLINLITFEGQYDEEKKSDQQTPLKTIRKINNLNQIDFKIFESPSKDIKCSKSGQIKPIIPHCEALERLCVALIYEQLLLDNSDHKTNSNQQEIFINFCVVVYKNLLNDWNHFITEHASHQQLMQIADELVNKYGVKICDLTQCNKMVRHYNYEETSANNDNKNIIQHVFGCITFPTVTNT